MAVVIRLQRTGKPNEAHYRIIATDKSRSVRGESIEIVGHYHPTMSKEKDKLTINLPRVEHWIKVGAKPSETVASLIRKVKRTAAKG